MLKECVELYDSSLIIEALELASLANIPQNNKGVIFDKMH